MESPKVYPALLGKRIEDWTEKEIDEVQPSRYLDQFIHRHVVLVDQQNQYAMNCCPPWSLDVSLLHIVMRRLEQRAIGFSLGAGHGHQSVDLHFSKRPIDSMTATVKAELVGDNLPILMCRAILKMFALKGVTVKQDIAARKKYDEENGIETPADVYEGMGEFTFSGYDEAREVPITEPNDSKSVAG